MAQKVSLEVAFGKVVRRRRREIGVSQEKLAEKADLHRTYVSQIERGLKSPSLKALVAVARALNTRPSQLLGEMEEELDGV